jgi:hypothetical protein
MSWLMLFFGVEYAITILVFLVALVFIRYRNWNRFDLQGSSTQKDISDLLEFLTQKEQCGGLYAMTHRGIYPHNFFYCKECIGWISSTTERGQTTYHIWCAKKKSNDVKKEKKEDTKKILQWNYTGGMLFEMDWINKELKTLKPMNTSQCSIIEDIYSFQHHSIENGYGYGGVFHIRGGPGTGKTTTAGLLATKILESDEVQSVNVANYDPLLPTNDWKKMLLKIRPTKSSPLIVMVDEADRKFQDCIDGKKEEIYKYFLTQCYDKESLNGWLDEVMKTDNVILLLTMNVKLEDTKMDTSVYRIGRRVQMYNLEEKCAQKVLETRFGSIPDVGKLK